jgi:uncharacterized protein
VIVADTGAVIALVDAGDTHHRALRRLYETDPAAWVLPWAILAEVDCLLGRHVGDRARRLFLDDLASGAFPVEWGEPADLERAAELDRKHAGLGLGLVDAVVMAVAERLEADAIATLDLPHFGAVRLTTKPTLVPRDT